MERKERNKKRKVLQSQLFSPAFLFEFNLYKIPTWPCGTWPLERDSLIKDLKCLFAFVVQVCTTTILYTEVFFACAETEVLIDYIGLGTCSLLAFSKTATFWYHSDKIFKSFLWMSEDYAETTDPKYREIMTTYAIKARRIFKVQMTATYFSAISFPLNVILLELLGVMHHVLPMQTTCTISNVTGYAYPPVFLEQCVHIYFVATGNIGHDLLFIGITMHVCGQLHILAKEYSKLTDISDIKECCSKFCELIDKHRRLYKMFDNVSECFSKMLMIQLSVSVGILCILGIQILVALMENNTGLFIKHTLFTGIVLFQLYLYAWAGDYLESNYDHMTNAVYASDWYKIPPKTLKNMIFVLMRTNRPTRFVAGYIYEINMVTFAAMLKMMMSMFSIVRLMFIEEN